MRALRYHPSGELRLEDLAALAPAPGEALIEVAAAGVCRTDVEIVTGLHPFYRDAGPPEPFVLGHEWSGFVRALGEGVDGPPVGALVVGETGIGCGLCDLCRIGRHNACSERVETGVFGRDGAMRELHVHPARLTYPCEGLEPEEAALVEPASVGVYACKRAEVRPGNRVLVLGGGSIGQMVVQAAQAYGADEVVLATRSPEKRELATQLGADSVFDASGEQLVAELSDHTRGDLFHVIIEATGAIESIRQAIDLARPLARIVVLGVFDRPLVQELGVIVGKELSILGSVGSPGVWPLTISLMQRGKIQARPLISAEFSLGDHEAAFAAVEKGGPGLIKCLLRP